MKIYTKSTEKAIKKSVPLRPDLAIDCRSTNPIHIPHINTSNKAKLLSQSTTTPNKDMLLSQSSKSSISTGTDFGNASVTSSNYNDVQELLMMLKAAAAQSSPNNEELQNRIDDTYSAWIG
jgi:hypothetical protein